VASGRTAYRRAGDGDGVPDFLREHAAREILGGLAALAVGLGLTWLLWEGGWVWGLTLVPIFSGVGLIASGLAAAKREVQARAQWPRIQREEARLVDSLEAVKARGGRPHEWLLQQGFSHRGIRNYLMEALRARSRAEPEAPGVPLGHETPFPRMRDLLDPAHELEDGDLARFERRQGVRLPGPYQRPLARFNGGTPRPAWFSYRADGRAAEGEVERFFSLGVTGPDDLDEACQSWRSALEGAPARVLPIARERGGGLLCLALEGKPGVYLHRRGERSGEAQFHLVSPDFFGFLASLTWAPGTEPPPAPKRRRR